MKSRARPIDGDLPDRAAARRDAGWESSTRVRPSWVVTRGVPPRRATRGTRATARALASAAARAHSPTRNLRRSRRRTIEYFFVGERARERVVVMLSQARRATECDPHVRGASTPSSAQVRRGVHRGVARARSRVRGGGAITMRRFDARGARARSRGRGTRANFDRGARSASCRHFRHGGLTAERSSRVKTGRSVHPEQKRAGLGRGAL